MEATDPGMPGVLLDIILEVMQKAKQERVDAL